MQLKVTNFCRRHGEDDRDLRIPAGRHRGGSEGIPGESHGRRNRIGGEDRGIQRRKFPVHIRDGPVHERVGGRARGVSGGCGGAALVRQLVPEGQGSGSAEQARRRGRGENGEFDASLGEPDFEGEIERDLERGKL